jgi:hypothetical protein
VFERWLRLAAAAAARMHAAKKLSYPERELLRLRDQK